MTQDNEITQVRQVSSTQRNVGARRVDGRRLVRKLVGSDKVNLSSGFIITQSQLANASVGVAQLKYESKTVTVTATQTVGTVSVTSGDVLIGIYPSTNQDQFIKSAVVSGTTLTVTLLAAATANNVFTAILLMA